MKIGIIVDGQAESQALRFITDKIRIAGTQILSPLYSDLQPRATPHQIVRAAYGKLQILHAKNVDKIILLIDCDDRRECGIDFANSINKAIDEMGFNNIETVVKVKCYENWLIADPDGISKMKSRFNVTNAFERNVSPNKADNVTNPEELLNTIAVKTRYKKGKDSIEISKHIDPNYVRLNSRSFRKFLKTLGHPEYVIKPIN